MTTVEVTKHGEKRVRQRVGINKSAVQRHVQNVYDNGKHQKELRGAIKKMAAAGAIPYKSTPVLFGNHIYCFKGNTLVTVLQVPGRMT